MSSPTKTNVDAERRYLALFDSINQGFCTVDVAFDADDRPTDCRIVEVSPSFARQTGIEAAAGRSMRRIAPDDDHWFEMCARVSFTGEPARFEQQSTPLGRWWSVYAFRIDDQPRGQIGILFNDITERKRGEDYHAFVLKLSDALRPLADPEAIQAVAADLLGAHLRVNHCHYAEVRGAYVNISHSYADGLPPMTGSFRSEDFGKRLMDGYRAGRLQVCVDTATDPLFSAEERQMLKGARIGAFIGVPLNKDGQWVGTFGVQTIEPREWTRSEIELVQEVTERTWAAVQHAAAAKALRKSEEKYRTLFDSVEQGVATVEVLFEGDKAIDYLILENNAAHEKMSGMPPTFVGKRVREVMPTIEESMVERVGRVALTGEPVRFEEYIGALGRWFDIHLSRVGGEGSRTVASLATNITERKRREQHAAFLDKLSQELVLLGRPEDIVRAAGEALGAYLDVSSIHVIGVELDPGEEPADARLTALATWERKGFFIASGAYRAGDYLSEEFLRAARAGEPFVVADTDTDPRTDREAYRAVGMRAFVAVPILKDSTWPGLVSVLSAAPRDWRPDEVTLIVELSHRVFLLFERARVQQALRESEEQLRRSRDELEHRVQERTSDLALANAQLHVEVAERRAMEAQIKALFERLVSVQEDERRRIARDIHDQLGQQMTALRMNLEATRLSDDARARGERLRRSMQLAEELDRSIDFLTSELRPSALDHFGLPAALRQLVCGWSDRFSIAAEFEAVRVDGLRLPHDIEANLYCLTQEALHNIVKHAAATHVAMILEIRDEQDIVLIVQDNGRGFAVSDAQRQMGGLGLGIMRERALLLGGVLEIDTAPGRGTAISVRIPIKGRIARSAHVERQAADLEGSRALNNQ
ncbi:MAG TPA: GAF domain-containing protein [Vicinamibacterales bacterium]|nr:GAF domain-containing protein [Vicinamibacterales bacterium]